MFSPYARNDRRVQCQICGADIAAKHTGRRRQFCSRRCRKAAQRLKNDGRYPPSGASRNAENSLAISIACKGDLAGRGSAICGPHDVVEVELIGGRAWWEVTSIDGVKSQVSVLRPRALALPGRRI